MIFSVIMFVLFQSVFSYKENHDVVRNQSFNPSPIYREVLHIFTYNIHFNTSEINIYVAEPDQWSGSETLTTRLY